MFNCLVNKTVCDRWLFQIIFKHGKDNCLKIMQLALLERKKKYLVNEELIENLSLMDTIFSIDDSKT